MSGFVDWSSFLLWGFVATLTLAGILYSAQEAGWSRMSIPFMLGTMGTTDRRRAKAIGFVAHLVNGLVFALFYCRGFEELGQASWWLGALGGVFHAAVVLTVILPILPYVHRNMATPRTGPEPTRWLQPPGFLALNYGRRTPLVTLAAHIVYGAVLGGFYTLA